ncbi:hybrid sensor histidine kinase/response regulator [Paramagnetospirillum magneticum]|uniref:hybrid sensor histidine kinase/response regulator n=1 Tax=Paramagnetospirillum magneticum TaxID=84159 RepID=UPI0002F363EA|nr:PAS domain S-box protein [Paramagnetospirillum magneticum]
MAADVPEMGDVPETGGGPAVAAADCLWSVDARGRLIALSAPLGVSLPLPWWRVVRLERTDRRALAISLKSGQPFSGLRASLRRGPLAGTGLDLSGRGRHGGWSGAALVRDDPPLPDFGTDGRRGADLIQAVLEQTATALAVGTVFVARRERDGTLIPEFAAADPAVGGDIVGHPYRSLGTACGDVLSTGRPLVVAAGLDERYPLLGRFRRLGVTAYAGAPLFDGSEAPGGVLVALGTSPFDDPSRVEAILAAAARCVAPHFRAALEERRLSHAAARFSSLLDNLPGMAYRVRMSPDGRRRMLYASQGAERLIGITPAEMCRLPSDRLLELRHPDDRERTLADTIDRLGRQDEVSLRWRLARPSGTVSWVRSSERLVGRDGADLLVEGLLQDCGAEVEVEDELARRVRELKAVADYAPDWESWLDEDGGLRWLSPGVEKVTGYTVEECRALAGYPRSLVCDEDLGVFDTAMAAAGAGSAVADIDIRIRRRWGEASWCSLSIQPVIADGHPAGLRLCIRRIDRRKAAEQMLHQREEEIARVLAALDLVREAVIVSNAEGTISYANAAAARLLGFEAAAALRGHPWRTLGLAGSSSAPFLDIIESSLASRGAWSGELVLGQGEGAIYLDTRFARMPQDGFIAVLTDIGARKLADEQLRENQERYRALFETAGDAIFLMEGAGIIDCNPRAEAVFGHGRGELQGHGLHDFAPPRQTDGRESKVVAAGLLAKALGGHPQAYEWLGRHKDGSLIHLDVTLTCVPRRGRPYLVAVVRDVTERRRREDEQRHLEQQLAQARKLEALGQLAGGVAHDFNNILGAIRGFADLLSDEVPAGSPGERYVRRILTASDRAKGVVRQILAFSRRSEVSHGTVDLGRLAEECLGLLRASLPATTGLTFNHGAGAAGTVVDGDRDQLSQVILNLVINANDALDGVPGDIQVIVARSGDGAELRRLTSRTRPELALAVEVETDAGGGVTAFTGRFDPDRPHVTLSIIDSGPGIPQAVIAHAFDPFFTTKAARQGTGLGLAVVHSIVLAHHGAIVVRSHPDRGCRFDIVLPMGQGDAAAEMAVSGTEAALPPGTRVLVVDDDADFGDMILAMLEHRGVEAAVVSSPLDALEVLRDHPDAWDVMVTDQTMPGMRGIDLVKAVKAIRPDLPCLICTGYPEALDEAALTKAGVFALLHKPVDFPHYFAQLARALAVD